MVVGVEDGIFGLEINVLLLVELRVRGWVSEVILGEDMFKLFLDLVFDIRI